MTESSRNHPTAESPDLTIPSSSPERCPGWCLGAPGHELDPSSEEWDGGERLHKGPLFGGLLRAWGNSYADGRPMTVTVDAEDGSRDYSTPEQLHALAQAAEQAAEWLEAHRLAFTPVEG